MWSTCVSDEVRKSVEGRSPEGQEPSERALPRAAEAGAGRTLALCNVVLRGESGGDMLQVVRALIEVGGLDKERALEAAFEAQMAGVATIVVTHRERAELYQDLFFARGVRVAVEGA